MKGPLPLPAEIPNLTPVCKWCCARLYKYAKYTSNTRRTFKCLQNGKPESRVLNSALAVYCLLIQRTQIAQIVIHTMNAYAFMGQNLEVIVFLQILMWALSKTPLKIYRERNSLQNSGCYKSKRVSVFIIFIPWQR